MFINFWANVVFHFWYILKNGITGLYGNSDFLSNCETFVKHCITFHLHEQYIWVPVFPHLNTSIKCLLLLAYRNRKESPIPSIWWHMIILFCMLTFF